MKTQKTDKVDEAVPQAPSAPKPLRKSSRVAAPGIVAKKLEQKAAEVASVTKVEKEPKVLKKLKLKIVRDSFTMPASEYHKISEIKELCLKAGVQVKKSEVLRAGVIALCAMNEDQLNSALSSLDKIKTGRPKKH